MKFIKKFFLLLFILIVLFFVFTFAIVSYGTLTRPVKYVKEVEEFSKEYDVDPLLTLAIIKVESNFRPDAVSHMNAHGLMQVVPETGKWIAEQMGENYEDLDLQDIPTNIKMGTYYLSYLLHHFSDHDLAIAAYNGGLGNVRSWLNDERYSDDQRTLKDIPIEETKNYVVKVNDQYEIYKIFYQDRRLVEDMNRSFGTMIQNYLQMISELRNFY